jgi:uncharacterized protein
MASPLRSHVLAACAFVACASAHAASFDCKAAKSPTEKAICASPKLSALDERMARDYDRAVHALSAAGAAQLKESQRNWLRFATRVCATRAAAQRGEHAGQCLETEYARRLDQLAQAGVRIGPFVFNRLDWYAAALVKVEEAGPRPGFVTDHVGYAQIDAPLDAATTAWNATQRHDGPTRPPSADPDSDTPPDSEGASDEDLDFTLGCVSDRFISLSQDSSEYDHGAAHPMTSHEVHNALLVPALRKMTAGDLFAANSGWKDKLPRLFWQSLQRDPDADKDSPPSVKEAVLAAGANPERWLLTPTGLQISFDSDEGGCHACNPGPITVPWATLKPMLASPDFAACKGPPATKP